MAADPILDFSQINSELALFDPALKDKPQIVVFNKMDLPDVQNRWPEIEKSITALGYEAHSISAVARTGVREVLYRAFQILQELPPEPEIKEVPVYRVESDPSEFEIERTLEGDWRVTGEAIERAANMTYWDHFQAIRRFQRILETLGVDKALRNAGVKEGDTVLIGDHELEWQD
jgi:GTP-binding protein